MPRVTSRDVAQAANVSQSLVSRAMTGNGAVAPETRARILRAAEELGWQHNALAASMVTGDVPFVAVVTARLNFDWRAQVLSHLLAAFDASGIVPLMFYAETDAMVARLLHDTGQWQTRGVVVTAGDVDPASAAQILGRGRFLATLNRPAPHDGAFAIGTDNARAGAEAAGLLHRAGHRRCLVLAGPDGSWAGSQRAAGFAAADPGADIWHTQAMSVEDGQAAAARWLALPPAMRPTGVFAANDLLAIGLIDGARAAGVRVPDDLSVIGFDDLPAAGWAPYRLTTFAQPVAQLVQGVLDHIDAHREDRAAPPPGMQLVAAQPVIRDSLGAAR